MMEGDDDAEVQGNYAWEEEYKKSWEMLQEDEHGSLLGVVSALQLYQTKRRKRLLRDAKPIQRGIIRHLFLVLDVSKAMSDMDLKPNRLECTLNLVEEFITEYFDQNPLSQLGIITTKDGLSQKLTDLSGNPLEHIDGIRKHLQKEMVGEPSLQNSLELAKVYLSHVPSHASREILFLAASLTTCDPGNIFETLSTIVKEKIRVSVIGLVAEVQIFKTIAKETRGSFGVVMNEAHYKELLFGNIPPPPMAIADSISSLIQMGFPASRKMDKVTLCACHQRLVRKYHECPRCNSKVCEIPTDCPICGLTLVSSPLLARSYHHLFPVPNYVEVPKRTDMSRCFGCQAPFIINIPPAVALSTNRRISSSAADSAKSSIPPNSSVPVDSGVYECTRCKQHFCLECDIFIHDVLHNCKFIKLKFMSRSGMSVKCIFAMSD